MKEYEWRLSIWLKSNKKIKGVWLSHKTNCSDVINEILPNNENINFLAIKGIDADRSIVIKVSEIEYIEILLPYECL